jgi:hypothetical protein
LFDLVVYGTPYYREESCPGVCAFFVRDFTYVHFSRGSRDTNECFFSLSGMLKYYGGVYKAINNITIMQKQL